MLYLFPLWLAAELSERSPSPLWSTSAATAILMVVGFWLCPSGISPWLGAADRVLFFIALVCTTVLLRKLIVQREALRRNEEELRDFLEGASEGIRWVGPDGTILWANQAELNLLGYASDEYIGHSIREFHADGDMEDLLRRMQKGETLSNYEGRLRCKDGSIRHVSIVSNVSRRDGRFTHTRCFTRDITAQKDAQQKHAYLAAIISSSDDGIVGKNLRGIVTSWNRGAERLFGYTAQEMIGQPALRLIPPERHDEERFILGRITAGESVQHYETIRRHKDGRDFYVSLTVSPVVDDQGQIIGASKICRDITQQKIAEETLRQRDRNLEEVNAALTKHAAALTEANKELESFSYSISHDLRAPLRSMDGFAKVLVEDFGPALPPDARRCLSIIQKGAGRMGELIDDLLEFSRLSRLALNASPLDLNKVIQEVWHELRRQDDGRPVELNVAELPKCRADRRLIKQVWVNLLSNALKYSRFRDQARIEIGWQVDARLPDHVVYWIRDNGVGFDQQYVHKLFGVFQRLHRIEEFEGTGVGLAIVQRIIQRHGGLVWAEGRVNHGATFYFTLERVYEHHTTGQHLGLVGRG